MLCFHIVHSDHREMQLLASAVYEEPWDTGKQQKQLQAKLQASNLTTGAGNEQEKSPRHKSSSDAQIATQEATESNTAVTKGSKLNV